MKRPLRGNKKSVKVFYRAFFDFFVAFLLCEEKFKRFPAFAEALYTDISAVPLHYADNVVNQISAAERAATRAACGSSKNTAGKTSACPQYMRRRVFRKFSPKWAEICGRRPKQPPNQKKPPL